ncbi:MAG TPA: phosphatase [Cryomorphaceae bacterium]|nr:phosphatase [Owenweeksia sp.]MBF97932.1 phosphatase [Owenweeksia sp.]HAD98027.1 phosphatase [Cryomorphaceae bacterium]HBF20896.1 phosphatase [Cryomorphaceae bacterium]
MKIAVIDLGTNTFNLLIRELPEGKVLFNDKLSVRLGDGGLNENRISEASFERGIRSLKTHVETCRKWEADEIYAFATSAVRSASNGQDFIKAAWEQTGIRINLIDGDQEAELIHLGVQQALELVPENALIMDIGGGSTEFIIANNQEVHWKRSYLLGSSRLMQKFQPSDPIKPSEADELKEYFEQELEELFEAARKHPVRYLIGSSGSFDTLAAMTAHRFQSPEVLEGQTTYTFDMYEYRVISKLMLESDFEQRLHTPGMIPMRADLIVLACVQIDFILNRLGIRAMKLSTYALKEGVLVTLQNKSHTWQKSSL